MELEIPHYRLSLVRERGTPFEASDTKALAKLAHALLDDSPVEKALVIYKNAQNQVIGTEFVAQGGLVKTDINPPEVFRGALLANAYSIVLAHNHPSGDSRPSQPDIETTGKLRLVGELLGINVEDHIVVSPDGTHTSIRDLDTFRRIAWRKNPMEYFKGYRL